MINRPRVGWKAFANPTEYLSELIWYDGELQTDDYVQAATIFTSGPNADWTDYDVDETLSRNLAAYIEQQRSLPAASPAPTPMSAEFALQRPLPDGTGWISQWFGDSTTDYSETGLAGHNGIDYAADQGTNVLAAHAGSCTLGQDAGYGTFVRVTTQDGIVQTLYAHLQDAAVTDGQAVDAQATIGHVGSTGNSSSPHLHFGWKVGAAGLTCATHMPKSSPARPAAHPSVTPAS